VACGCVRVRDGRVLVGAGSYVEARVRLLDLFSGAGGAAVGYARAGFEVVGVDIEPQPNYPFEFHQADALEFCREHGHEFDAIHASPPCQAYTPLRAVHGKDYPDMLAATREALEATGLPWVIENVPGAPINSGIFLCGTMFDLRVYRHRWFETPFMHGIHRRPTARRRHLSGRRLAYSLKHLVQRRQRPVPQIVIE
jgi:hypothetical protein